MGVAKTLKKLEALLDLRNEHPEQLAAVDRKINLGFLERHAIMVLDMAGFSRLTIKHGIIHFLAMIRRMQVTIVPIIRHGRGRVVISEADNVFAVFSTVAQSVAAAKRIHAELGRMNEVLPEDWDIHVSIGIGYGDVLMVGDHDFFGSELNLASKLGEDVATAGDILVTAAAFARLGRARKNFVKRQTRVGKVPLQYFALPAAKTPSQSPSPRGKKCENSQNQQP